jgi:Leucine-rich repeat (LRR) protein
MNSRWLTSLIVGFVLCIGVSNLSAQTPKHIEPTEEQLETAKKAFEKMGITLSIEGPSEQTSYVFVLPPQIEDKDLKNLPAVPFLFVLDCKQIKMTDARLKEIASLKNLTGLYLSIHNNQMTDAGLKDIASLKDLTALHLESNKVTGAGLKEIAKLKKLKHLLLNVSELNDAGLKEIATLDSLEVFAIECTPKVTDAGLKEIAKLKNLNRLYLFDIKLTDAGLKEIANFKNLKDLHFPNDVTDEELRILEAALPKCKIHRGFLDIP